jgi:pseudouridine synthase
MGMRLQKALAQAGIASRRASEEIVRAGRVRVNGRLAQLGMVVDPAIDSIELDGLPLVAAETLTHVMLNKPPGVLSSLHSQGGRPTVRELLPQSLRLYPVGRLDLQSEGLLLMTNDGGLAQRLTHPRFGHEKTYRILLDHRPTEGQLEAWRRGPVLADGTRFGPAIVRWDARQGEERWIEVVIREGQKRQLRRSAEALGLRVRRLVRVGFGGLSLGGLRPGEWRPLTDAELRILRQDAPREPGVRRPAPRRSNGEKVGNR